MTPFLDARFGLRWITHSKLPNEIKPKLCETIKHLVVDAASQSHGSIPQEKADNTIDSLPVDKNNSSINSL